MFLRNVAKQGANVQFLHKPTQLCLNPYYPYLTRTLLFITTEIRQAKSFAW